MKFLLSALLLFAPSALAANEALTQCRAIEELEERVACYDEIVDSLYAKPTVVPDAHSLFGTNDAEAKRIVEETLEIEQIDQIESTVADVRISSTSKLTVALDNGQVWRQLDSKPLRLESGDGVIIRKASLGSFLLEKKSGSRSIRVKRAD
jgi:hypothetical protein